MIRHDTEMPREFPMLEQAEAFANGTWEWRNTRSVGLGIQIWSSPWVVEANFDADVYGGTADVSFGPFVLTFYFNCGSDENARRIEQELVGPQVSGASVNDKLGCGSDPAPGDQQDRGKP